jgi:hypothetical protein
VVYLSSLVWVMVQGLGPQPREYYISLDLVRSMWAGCPAPISIPRRQHIEGISHSRLFAKSGYRVAVIARRAEGVNRVAQDVKSAGGEVGMIFLS